MTPALLLRVGRALYGTPDFRHQMAADLNVAVREVSRWRAGTSPVPYGVERELRRRVEALQTEVGAILAEPRRS